MHTPGARRDGLWSNKDEVPLAALLLVQGVFFQVLSAAERSAFHVDPLILCVHARVVVATAVVFARSTAALSGRACNVAWLPRRPCADATTEDDALDALVLCGLLTSADIKLLS